MDNEPHILLALQEQLSYLRVTIDCRLSKLETNISRVSDECLQLSQQKLMKKTQYKKTNPKPEDCKETGIYSLQNSYLDEFYKTISLSGIHYVTIRKPNLHRILWILIHVVVFVLSYSYIQEAYDEWQSSPIVKDLTKTKVQNIPFPAITVCEPLRLKDEYNQDEVLRKCVHSMKNKTSWVCSEEELNMFKVSTDIKPLLLRKSSSEWHLNKESFDKLTEGTVDIRGVQYLGYVHELAKDVDRSTLKVRFFSKAEYSEINVTTVTRTKKRIAGMDKCSTFNGIKHEINNIHVKAVEESTTQSGVDKSSTCSPDQIMEDVCKAELFYTKDDTFIWFQNSAKTNFSYYTYFHHPLDYQAKCPDFRIKDFYWPIEARFGFSTMQPINVELYLHPKLTKSRKDLLELETSRRDCVFSHERKLSLFTFYSQQNCIVDCKFHCSLAACGCLPLSVAIFNSTFKVCSRKRALECERVTGVIQECDNHNRCLCDCPPDCVSLNYEISIVRPIVVGLANTIDLSYFKADFVSTNRYSANSPTEFLAYSLGILSLFNCFSLALVWEILHWMTLRLWFTVKRYSTL